MQALVFRGPGRIELEEVPAPRRAAAADAIVKVEASGLCGSDLHPYRGREPARTGVVAGHEAVGEVVEAAAAGPGVGTRVIVPFTTSCGACPPCRSGLSARCTTGRLFGWGDPDRPDAPALDGAQAEYLLVPDAAGTLVEAGEIPAVEGVLLADNVPTGWYAALRCDAAPGRRIAVVGLGSVGLAGVLAARRLGARVTGTDLRPDRRATAERLGATVVAPDDLEPGGYDGVIEAAGAAPAQRLAASALRPGGTLSIIAVTTAPTFAFTPAEAYDRNLTVRSGRAPVRSLLADGAELWDVARELAGVAVTHAGVALGEGRSMYRRFSETEEGLIKVVFDPSR